MILLAEPSVLDSASFSSTLIKSDFISVTLITSFVSRLSFIIFILLICGSSSVSSVFNSLYEIIILSNSLSFNCEIGFSFANFLIAFPSFER